MRLSDTCKRLAGLSPDMAVGVGPQEEGWFTAAELSRPHSPRLQQALALMAARYHPGMQHRTRAAFLMDLYAADVPAFAVAAYLLESRVPDLSPENVALRFEARTWQENGNAGETERLCVRLLSERMAVLPGDTAADRAEVVVMKDKAALRDWLRAGLETHLQPLIDCLYRCSGLPRRALWRLAADSVAALFLGVGEAVGNDRLGLDDGEALVKTPGSPLNNRQTGYISRSVSDPDMPTRVVRETFRIRGGCCRFFTLPDSEHCTTCVLRKADDRDLRLRAYLVRRLADQP